MSFHFTQFCAFIAYPFRFYGLLFVFYRGKYTKKMELARREIGKMHNYAKNIANLINK